jgi:hypothetical protein
VLLTAKHDDAGSGLLKLFEWCQLPAFRAAQQPLSLSWDTGCSELRVSTALQRKNPPRISADGFWARQMTLNKTPQLTGPVNRGSIFLSTGGGKTAFAENPARQA